MIDKPQSEPIIELSETEKEELESLKETYNAFLRDIMDTADFDLYQVYPETAGLEILYKQLTDLKKCLDSFRPFNKSQMANLQEVFDTEYTYESNRIEGNTLTLMETDLVIHKGMTIEGKPLKDHFEAVNHLQGIEYIREVVKEKKNLSNKVLLDIHSLILQGIDRENAGSYRMVNVRISGSRHICPSYIKVANRMDEYFNWYESNKNTIHPVQLAAEMHEKLVSIHPFIDGNGRTARLVMNLILLQNGYPITIIASDRKKRLSYYESLEACHLSETGDNSEFKLLIAEYVKIWLFNYLNMIASNIDEASKDKGYYFFKKIELFLDKK